jgi:hypothetical protein
MYFLLNPRLDWKKPMQGDEKVSKSAQKVRNRPLQAENSGCAGA